MPLSIYDGLLSSLIPPSFKTIKPHLTKFLTAFGEERCESLYNVCKDYSEEELGLIYRAMAHERNKLLHRDIKQLDEHTLDHVHQILITAAYAAPVMNLYGHMKRVESDEFNDRVYLNGVKGILRGTGDVINCSKADSIVVEIPDMDRHDHVIFRGALVALLMPHPYNCDRELLQYMGEHWRELAPHMERISEMQSFNVREAAHLIGGGAPVLSNGAL